MRSSFFLLLRQGKDKIPLFACRFFYPKKKVYILMAVSRNVFSALLI